MKKIGYKFNDNSKIIEFSVDWNSPESIDEVLKKLKSRNAQLKKESGDLKRKTKTEMLNEALDCINSIIETDISHLFNEGSEEKDYYVYAHCDESRKIDIFSKRPREFFAASIGLKYLPFYIGKGRGDRYLKEGRNGYHNIIKTQRSNYNIDKRKIKNNLSEKEALIYESKLIDIFGLMPFGGLLSNIDEGQNHEQRKIIFKKELEIIMKYK